MSLLTVPNVFANGTGPANIIDATQMNANFTAVATAVNNIYPSQILPLTAGQATFGATATGVGYEFLANDATATPLTISGVTSQSADIFDVTLTSGGTKAVFVNSGGALAFGSSLGLALPNGPSITGGISGSLILNATASQAILFARGATGTTTLGAFDANGVFISGAGTISGPTAAGSLVTATAAAQGFVGFGSGAAWASLDYGNTNTGAHSFRTTADSAYSDIWYNTAHPVSARAAKKDIQTLAYDPTDVIKSLTVQSWRFNSDDDSAPLRIGAIADELPPFLTDPKQASFNPENLAWLTVAALQALRAEFDSYIQAHP